MHFLILMHKYSLNTKTLTINLWYLSLSQRVMFTICKTWLQHDYRSGSNWTERVYCWYVFSFVSKTFEDINFSIFMLFNYLFYIQDLKLKSSWSSLYNLWDSYLQLSYHLLIGRLGGLASLCFRLLAIFANSFYRRSFSIMFTISQNLPHSCIMPSFLYPPCRMFPVIDRNGLFQLFSRGVWNTFCKSSVWLWLS